MPASRRSLRIRIQGAIMLDEGDLEWRFSRSSGPGGQNVNKVSTAVQVRYEARSHLPVEIYARLHRLAGRRLSQEGVLTISARSQRTQERNRQQALERLVGLLKEAAESPTPRTATRPTAASRARRLEAKRRRGTAKVRRRRVADLDD